jgi:hypothetical protein
MDPDFWIELESTYRERIAQRKVLYAAHGSKVMDAKPGTELASRSVLRCKTALNLLSDYLITSLLEQGAYGTGYPVSVCPISKSIWFR